MIFNKLFYIINIIAQTRLTLGIVRQGQGHGRGFKFFSIYHSANCEVLYLSFGTLSGDIVNAYCSIYLRCVQCWALVKVILVLAKFNYLIF